MDARCRSAQRARHAPYRLAHHRDGDQPQAMQHPRPGRAVQRVRAIRKKHQGDCRRQCEASPGSQCAEISRPNQSDGKSHLAAGRTGKKLAERDEIGVGRIANPAPAHDEFLAKVTDVGNRSAE